MANRERTMKIHKTGRGGTTIVWCMSCLIAGTAIPAWAGGGDGSRGSYNSGRQTGGAGGSDSTTGTGETGGAAPGQSGGGGGGAGVTGGRGSDGASGGEGGGGGSSAGAAGENGGDAGQGYLGGGGGGGGAHGFFGGYLPTGNVRGGVGGKGGYGLGGGGGGGGGGYGAVITGGGDLGVLNTSILAGNGGAGGTGYYGANGGSGGVGILFANAAPATITINGTVRGGDGGAAGTPTAGDLPAFRYGYGGPGGVGIIGQNLTIVVGSTGVVSGGEGIASRLSDVPIRFNAIQFTGGTNTLELQPGATIVGRVIAGSNDTYRVNESGSSSLDLARFSDQFSGFRYLEKTGGGTLTLIGGSPDQSLYRYRISAGTLVGDTSAFRGRTIENNGVLVFNQAVEGLNVLNITGTGSVVKEGAGRLSFEGTHSYEGDTVINAGTLQLGYGRTTGSVSGNIVNNSSLVFNRSNDFVYDGQISGAGSMTKAGGGKLTLTGDSTFTGATSIIGGELAVNGDLSSTSGVMVENGGVLSGTGNIAGLVTVRSGGTLSAGNSPGLLTVDSLALDAGSMTVFELNSPGVIGGTGVSGNDLVRVRSDLSLGGLLEARAAAAGYYRLFDYGAGGSGRLTGTFDTLRVTSTNTGFTIASYELQTGIGGQVNLAVLGQGQTIRFWDGADGIGNGAIDGGAGRWGDLDSNWTGQPGEAEINGPWVGSVGIFGGLAGGVVVVDGAQDFDTLQFSTDGYVLSGGMLRFEPASGTAGTIQIDNTISAEIGSVLADGTGASSLTKTGGGTLTLTGINTYTGGTGLLGGVLSVSHERNLGAGALTFDGGVLRVTGTDFTSTARTIVWGQGGGFDIADAANAFTVGQPLGGTGGLIKSGAGTLILTGPNSYAGGTTILCGTLQIGDGGSTGAIGGNIVNNGTLVFYRKDEFSLSGAITGNGTIRQVGDFARLDGDGSGFTGTTRIEAGTLAINGQLGGALDVLAGAKLSGTGTVGTTTVSGTVAPGNSIGTLNVAGSITFHQGSIYQVEADATGRVDAILATGGAILSGGTVAVLAGEGNYAPSTKYKILTAEDGVNGSFAGVTSNLAFLDPFLSYDPTGAYLTLLRNDVEFANVGLSRNQIGIARTVEKLGWGTPIYRAVVDLSQDQARAAFSQLSGEIHASAKSVLVEDSQFLRDAASERIRAAFDGVAGRPMPVMAYAEHGGPALASATEGLVSWGQGFGAWSNTQSDGSAGSLKQTSGGVFLGVDTPLLDTWRVGLLTGYSRTEFDVSERASSGTSDNYHLALYGGGQLGRLGLRSALAYTWHNIETDRSIDFPGLSDRLAAKYDAGTFQTFGEMGYRVDTRHGAFEPFTNIAYVALRTDDFFEGGGATALHGKARTVEATFFTAGLRASSALAFSGIRVSARGMLGWRHALGDDAPLALQALAGAEAFAVAGAPIARNSAVVEAGLDVVLSDAATIGLSYSGQFASHVQQHGFRAGLSLSF